MAVTNQRVSYTRYFSNLGRVRRVARLRARQILIHHRRNRCGENVRMMEAFCELQLFDPIPIMRCKIEKNSSITTKLPLYSVATVAFESLSRRLKCLQTKIQFSNAPCDSIRSTAALKQATLSAYTKRQRRRIFHRSIKNSE